jgi:quinol monooxygenase YgiN
MITRIVKLNIADAHIADFRATFRNNHARIVGFPGCHEVRLVHDVNDPNIHFTISVWDAESDLNNYRNSEIFASIWSTVKPWFQEKAEAWSTEEF